MMRQNGVEFLKNTIIFPKSKFNIIILSLLSGENSADKIPEKVRLIG